MIDLSTYQPKGDKKNSDFFEEFLPKVYERRPASGSPTSSTGWQRSSCRSRAATPSTTWPSSR